MGGNGLNSADIADVEALPLSRRQQRPSGFLKYMAGRSAGPP
jgi:hypothetical protein